MGGELLWVAPSHGFDLHLMDSVQIWGFSPCHGMRSDLRQPLSKLCFQSVGWVVEGHVLVKGRQQCPWIGFFIGRWALCKKLPPFDTCAPDCVQSACLQSNPRSTPKPPNRSTPLKPVRQGVVIHPQHKSKWTRKSYKSTSCRRCCWRYLPGWVDDSVLVMTNNTNQREQESLHLASSRHDRTYPSPCSSEEGRISESATLACDLRFRITWHLCRCPFRRVVGPPPVTIFVKADNMLEAVL